MRLLPRWSLTALALALLPSAVAAQNQYEEQVLAQLELAADVFFSAGYEPLLWDAGALDDDATDLFTVTLQAGYTYALVGVCDEDCSDIDLSLLDGYGNLVVEDIEVDDAPVIEFTVTASGDFTLGVEMYECSVEPCYYGVGLFGW